jgi:hypothetical protein
MNRFFAAMLLVFLVVSSSIAQEVAEPRSGTKFSTTNGDTSCLGVGLRTKTFAKVKVYAIGLYVADFAISGPLKGKAGTPELYRELVNGDFKKIVIMKFLRDVSTSQIRDAFNESLNGVGGPYARVDQLFHRDSLRPGVCNFLGTWCWSHDQSRRCRQAAD